MNRQPVQPAAKEMEMQGLSGCWVISRDGLGIRTDLVADGLAYRIFLWTEGSVVESSSEQWAFVKKENVEKRAEAGQKGAYGKLRGLEEELDAQFERLIISELHARKGNIIGQEQSRELIESVARTHGVDLFSMLVAGNRIEIICSLNGAVELREIVSRWMSEYPEVIAEERMHVKALKPQDIEESVEEVFSILKDAVKESVESMEGAEEEIDFEHVTVLLHESVDMLEPKEGKLIIDATLGGGGHTELMLERGATVWGIDQDPDARKAARKRLSRFGERFKAIEGNFRDVASLLNERGVSKVDGLLADLGISSHQVDTPERGFSFREDGPLDMRMNPEARQSAADIVNHADEKELADMIWKYGEEKASRRIARAIVQAREEGRIETTSRLADVVASVLPRKGKQHPATRTFQAIRIAVNDELGALEDLLNDSVELLNKDGRLAVITFHSLEDRIVKRFFDHHSRPEVDRKEWPAPRPNPDYVFNLINRKPVTAGETELSTNTRSRSAKLRGVVKIK